MKNALIVFLLLGSFNGFCQIIFYGNPQPMKHLNTPHGQNYLVLDQHSDLMAYTEERPGRDGENQIEEVLLDSSKVYLLKDWLSTSGLVTPIGFFDNQFYYNHVIFSAGRYFGVVMKFHMDDEISEPVRIPSFSTTSPFQNGCLSKDGEYMILSLESTDTQGVEDLYVVKKNDDGTWTRAINLGEKINTKYQEITPYLASDNKTLFFATNGRGGYGSFDIYYSKRLDGTWRNWTKPVNLGDQVNTSGAETSFSYRDKDLLAYYVSAQNSDGYGDIYQIQIKEILQDSLEVEEKPEPRIELQIVNASTNEPISASLIKGGNTINNPNGQFQIDSLNNFEVEIKAQGFLPKVIQLNNSLKIGTNIIPLTAIAKGETIPLSEVLFKRGTASLLEGSEKELNLLVEMMNDHPNVKILLKGHTDNAGNANNNLKLSEARVGAVTDYILANGIDSERIKGRGFGGTQPIASNHKEYTRKRNRRVEFEVIDN